MSSEDGRILLNELQTAIDFLKQNWTDSIGKQYILWLEQTQTKIKEIERRREIISLKKVKIKLICESINSEGDADDPKKLTLKR